MFKEFLKESQPMVYQVLASARKNHTLSHAYLFYGVQGTPKKETALFLAQTILCEKQGEFACEACGTCQRVARLQHADLIYLSSKAREKEDRITKDNIDALQVQFSKTALEESGEKVYILDGIDAAGLPVQNGILKFLEEPAPHVTAILIASNLNAVLPTIQSRCTLIPFVPVGLSTYYKEAKRLEMDEADAYFLSHVVHSVSSLKEMAESEAYGLAITMLKQFCNAQGLRKELLVDYEVQYREKDKAKNLEAVQAFLSLVLMYYHDCILPSSRGPKWYQDAITKEKGTQAYFAQCIQVIAQSKDRCNKSNDLNLLLAQMMYRLEEIKHDGKTRTSKE